MWVLATITDSEALEFLTRLFPFRVRLDDDPNTERFLDLEAPTEVALVEGRGLRVSCPAKVRWSLPMGGLDVTINFVRALLRPSVVTVDGHAALRFVIEVEDINVEWVPALLDQKLAEIITKKLGDMPLEWNFTKTLTHRFPLPDLFDPPRDLATSVREPTCTVTSTAMTLGLFVAVEPCPAAVRVRNA